MPLLHPDVHIDLGGIAKGYAVDLGMTILQKAGVKTALIRAGGDTWVIGKRLDRPWNIGIRNPRNEEDIVSMIPLEDAAISTSGDYERLFEEDGVRYHHILKPRTGMSTHEIASSSVIITSQVPVYLLCAPAVMQVLVCSRGLSGCV